MPEVSLNWEGVLDASLLKSPLSRVRSAIKSSRISIIESRKSCADSCDSSINLRAALLVRRR